MGVAARATLVDDTGVVAGFDFSGATWIWTPHTCPEGDAGSPDEAPDPEPPEEEEPVEE